MLAEKKTRLKWTINPRGNLWSNDNNKFGQKMLEKMGWEAGKGLGATGQGITEHIKVSVKSDKKCFGYKETTDEWIEQRSQFEDFLTKLNTSHNNDTSLDDQKGNYSLEKKSRESKSRVHYQKFTRGKDLSNYSANDLASILGVKKTNNNKKETKVVDSHIGQVETSFGVTAISGGNMDAYFNKLRNKSNSKHKTSYDLSSENADGKNFYAEKKKKKQVLDIDENSEVKEEESQSGHCNESIGYAEEPHCSTEHTNNGIDTVHKKRKKKSHKFMEESLENGENEVMNTKKIKKKYNDKDCSKTLVMKQDESLINNYMCENGGSEINLDKKKKSNNSKHKPENIFNEEDIENILDTYNSNEIAIASGNEDNTIKQKKKKKKQLLEGIGMGNNTEGNVDSKINSNESVGVVQNDYDIALIPKKKKKKHKSSDVSTEDNLEDQKNDENTDSSIHIAKKDKKKSCNFLEDNLGSEENVNENANSSSLILKRKKKKTHDISEEHNSEGFENTGDKTGKENKKRKKKNKNADDTTGDAIDCEHELSSLSFLDIAHSGTEIEVSEHQIAKKKRKIALNEMEVIQVEESFRKECNEGNDNDPIESVKHKKKKTKNSNRQTEVTVTSSNCETSAAVNTAENMTLSIFKKMIHPSLISFSGINIHSLKGYGNVKGNTPL